MRAQPFAKEPPVLFSRSALLMHIIMHHKRLLVYMYFQPLRIYMEVIVPGIYTVAMVSASLIVVSRDLPTVRTYTL